MLKNSIISYIINQVIGIIVFVLSIKVIFGSFQSSTNGTIVNSHFCFSLTVMLVSFILFFCTGILLNNQGTKTKNLLSVCSPMIWMLVLYSISALILDGNPKGCFEVFFGIAYLANYIYPLIIELQKLPIVIWRILMILLYILPTLLMWLGLKFASKRRISTSM